MDLTAGAKMSPVLKGAEMRNCEIVEPVDLLIDTLELQAKTLTGKAVSRDVLKASIPQRFLIEE
jgi:hypothetical protein